MGFPRPDDLCEICQNLDLLGGRDIPWEEEDAIPHQPNIVLLEESSQTCSLCLQIWFAAGWSLANRGGMVTFSPSKEVDGVKVTVQRAASNFGMASLFRAMANGAMVTNAADDIAPDFSEKDWVHPRSLVDDPYKIGSYLYGNWWKSPYVGREGHLMLIGLGVRLGTSPRIGDALGNKPDEWFLGGSYLRFRTTYDCDLTGYIPGKIRNWDLSSHRALGQVKEWLQICDQHHDCLTSHKSGDTDTYLPTRVLWVENGDVIRLVESNGATGRYIALSHCWGKSHRLMLNKGNISQLKDGLDMAQIPQTFRDAIEICRALGIAYLWIDSLCIIQDDSADWEIEASRMGNVYLDAYLTISALHSADDADGCFPSITRESKPMPFPFVSPDVVCTGRATTANAVPFLLPRESTGDNQDSYRHAVVFSMHGTENKKHYITNEWMPPSTESKPHQYGTFNFGASFDPLKSEPLSSRGWVLQERLLAQRTIHYSEGQMYWECQNWVLGEDGSMLKRMFPQLKTLIESRKTALKIYFTGPSDSPQYKADEWLSLVEAFCRRQLTMDYDKLVALSGLARTVANQSNDEYCAGVWKSNFLNGICWKKKTFVPSHHCSDEDHEAALPEATAAQITPPSKFRAPSWSWASVDGEIEFSNRWLGSSNNSKLTAQVLDIVVAPLGTDVFGQVKSGHVKLLTQLGELRLDSSNGKGQDTKGFHVTATLVSLQSEPLNQPSTAKLEQGVDKPRRLSKLFSGLSLKKSDAPVSPPKPVKAKPSVARVLFDMQPEFPCVAAFITNEFALVLRHNSKDDTYARIGIAELNEDAGDFLKVTKRTEAVII